MSSSKSQQKPLTKKEFETLLKKAAQPKKKLDLGESQTSESRHSDDYTDKRKNPDIPEGKEG